MLLHPGDLQPKSQTRRIPVRGERSKGWRTRVVGHASESQLNPAACVADKLIFDGIEVLVAIVLASTSATWPSPCGRDVANAFRRVPGLSKHLDLA